MSSYVEMPSDKVLTLVGDAERNVARGQARLKAAYIADARASRWNRFWWLFRETPTDEEIWQSYANDFLGPHAHVDMHGWRTQQVAEEAKNAALRAPSVKLSLEDLHYLTGGPPAKKRGVPYRADTH